MSNILPKFPQVRKKPPPPPPPSPPPPPPPPFLTHIHKRGTVRFIEFIVWGFVLKVDVVVDCFKSSVPSQGAKGVNIPESLKRPR